jgi:hypothetical protein
VRGEQINEKERGGKRKKTERGEQTREMAHLPQQNGEPQMHRVGRKRPMTQPKTIHKTASRL